MEITPDFLYRRFPFFEGPLLAELAEKAVLQQVATGEEILHEGQLIRSFPLVLEGSLRIVRTEPDGRELLLYFLQPGEVCSMALTCCMGRQQSNIRAVAEQESLVARVPVECLDKWMVQFPGWKSYMMYAYRKRFDELLETIDSIAFMQMDQRLERFLKGRFEATGQTIFAGTHHDIASQLNTSREVVSRLLKKMEQKGMVRLGRNQIDFSSLINRSSK